jgi:hypothetical protein
VPVKRFHLSHRPENRIIIYKVFHCGGDPISRIGFRTGKRGGAGFNSAIGLIRLAMWYTSSISADLSGNPLSCERIMPETVSCQAALAVAQSPSERQPRTIAANTGMTATARE